MELYTTMKGTLFKAFFPGLKMLFFILCLSQSAKVFAQNQSDIIENGKFLYPSNIDYRLYQADTGLNATNSIPVFGFILQDGGATGDTDKLGTILNRLTIYSPTMYSIRTAALADSTGKKVAEVKVNSDSIIFKNLNIQAPDNHSHKLTLFVTFRRQVREEQLSFEVTYAATKAKYSGLAAINAGGATNSLAVSPQDRIKVTPTHLNFERKGQTSVATNDTLDNDVIINAADDFNNNDTDYYGKYITITAKNLTLGPNVTTTFYASLWNYGMFDDIYFTNTTGSYGVLEASDSTLTGVSDTFFIIEKIYHYKNSLAGVPGYVSPAFTGSNLAFVNGPGTVSVKQCAGSKIKISSKNWTTKTSLAFINSDNAIEISLIPKTGYTANITTMGAQFRTYYGGATLYRFGYSLDSGKTWKNNGSDISILNTSVCNSGTPEQWDFDRKIASTGKILFRVFAFGSTKQANEVSSENIWIGGFAEKIHTVDAGAFRMDSINPTICAGNVRLVAEYKNYGSSTLDSVAYIYAINSIIQDTLYFKDSVAKGMLSGPKYLGKFTFTPGAYKISSYTWMPNGQADSVTLNDTMHFMLNVYGKPTPSIIGKDTLCQGDSLPYYSKKNAGNNYAWILPAGIKAGSALNTDSIQIKYLTPGNYVLKMMETNGVCSDSASKTITVYPSPVILFSGKDSLCMNSSTLNGVKINGNQYTSSPAMVSQVWKVSGANYKTTTDSIYLSYKNSKTASVTISGKSARGCASSITRNFTFLTALPIKLSGDSMVCPNTIHKYSVVPAGKQNQMNFGQIILAKFYPTGSSVTDSILATWPMTGGGAAYVYAATEDSNNCIASDTMTVIVNKAPSASFGYSITGKMANQYNLLAADTLLKSYNWTVADTVPVIIKGYDVNYTFANSGKYKVSLQVTDTLGCSSRIDSTLAVVMTGIQAMATNDTLLLSVAPNPFMDLLRISVNASVRIMLYDQNGKMVTESAQSLIHLINTENLAKGVYMLRLQSGGQIINKKVVKF